MKVITIDIRNCSIDSIENSDDVYILICHTHRVLNTETHQLERGTERKPGMQTKWIGDCSFNYIKKCMNDPNCCFVRVIDEKEEE